MDNSIRSTDDADERGSIEHHCDRLMTLVRDEEQRFPDDHPTSRDLAHRSSLHSHTGCR